MARPSKPDPAASGAKKTAHASGSDRVSYRESARSAIDPKDASMPSGMAKRHSNIPAPASAHAKGVGEEAVRVKHYRIAVGHLTRGMFVAELDRLWIDTPFLMQSFLINSQAELEALRRYCKYVYVDLELSTSELADAIRGAEQASAALIADLAPTESLRKSGARSGLDAEPSRGRAIRDRPHDSRANLAVKRSTRARFTELVGLSPDPEDEAQQGSWLERLGDWVGKVLGGSGPKGASALHRATSSDEGRDLAPIRKLLPESVQLRTYEDVANVVTELPRARAAFAAGEATLNNLVNDIRAGRGANFEQLGQIVDQIVDSMIGNPDALMWVARLRDEDVHVYNHGMKVALYLVALGRHLGFPKRELSHLGMIGMLADVGKTRIPRNLLDKPGMLSPAEYNIVKEHVRLGLEALGEGSALPDEVRAGIAQHHERLDGSGYPKGLAADEIGIYGRMAGVADCFAALTTPRPYANPSPPQNALMNLYEWAGTSFHEPIVEQFVQAVGVFPVGSMVELSNGEVAIVLAHNRVRRLEPKVLVLTAPDKSAIRTPRQRDLLGHAPEPDGRPLRISRGLPTGAYGLKIRDYYGSEIAREASLA